MPNVKKQTERKKIITNMSVVIDPANKRYIKSLIDKKDRRDNFSRRLNEVISKSMIVIGSAINENGGK